MDVLRPQMVVVANRSYRKNPIKRNDTNTAEDEYLEGTDDFVQNNYCDEVCDAFTNIEETPNGFRVVLDIPSAYFKYIIGKKGETKKRLETETRTQVRIPKLGQEGEIVIVGHERRGVSSAKNRIDMLVETARQKQPFTHFLSIPINSIEVFFSDFKTDVLRECDGSGETRYRHYVGESLVMWLKDCRKPTNPQINHSLCQLVSEQSSQDRGLDASLFQNPKKLHLTLGTLALLTESETDQAVRVLHSCKEDLIQPILKGQKLQARIQQLEYMNDDPSSVDVLYAQLKLADDSDLLQIVCDRVIEKFSATGLMPQQFDRVKLHVTVMNTLFRKDPSGASAASSGTRGTPRESFDGSRVLRKFGQYDFGPQEITSLHLSQRHSTGPEGYYACVESIPLS